MGTSSRRPLRDARATVEVAGRRVFAGDGRTGGWEREDPERLAALLDRLGGRG